MIYLPWIGLEDLIRVLVENGEWCFVGHVDVELFVDAFLIFRLYLEQLGVLGKAALFALANELFAIVPRLELAHLDHVELEEPLAILVNLPGREQALACLLLVRCYRHGHSFIGSETRCFTTCWVILTSADILVTPIAATASSFTREWT